MTKPVVNLNKGITDGTLNADETKVHYGRSKDKTRVSVRFPIEDGAAEKSAPSFPYYDETKKAWEKRITKSVNVSMLATTAISFALAEQKGEGVVVKEAYTSKTGKRGTKSGAHTWQVKVISRQSAVKPPQKPGDLPDGPPQKVTTFNLTVPAWVNKFIFANSIFKVLDKEITHVKPGEIGAVGQIVGYVTPNGKSLSVTILRGLEAAKVDPADEVEKQGEEEDPNKNDADPAGGGG